VPEIRASNRQTRALGERLAVNSVMQGTAADIIKVAMVSIHRRFTDEGRGSRLVLQVHDELGQIQSYGDNVSEGLLLFTSKPNENQNGQHERMRTSSGEWKMEQLKGRIIYKGKAEGEALVTSMPISFYGGVDPNTGIVLEKGHELQGVSVKDKILVFPQGKGSTVGSYTLYRMKKNGTAPAAMINKETETIVAVGAIISEIPFVDKIDVSKIKTGNKVTVENDAVSIA
jgi:predicted aconitase with swiveling domain